MTSTTPDSEPSSARYEDFQSKMQSRVQEGRPYPLGAYWDGSGVNFAIFSAHATKVELCLFDADGKEEIERIDEALHWATVDAGIGQIPKYRSDKVPRLGRKQSEQMGLTNVKWSPA